MRHSCNGQSWPIAKISNDFNIKETALLQHFRDGRSLVKADFNSDSPGGGQKGLGLGQDRPIRIKTVRAAIQCAARFVIADAAIQVSNDIRRNVRRIADKPVKSGSQTGRVIGTDTEQTRRDAKIVGIGGSARQSVLRYIGRNAGRIFPVRQNRDRKCTCPCANIREPEWCVRRGARENRIDKQFRIGPWLQGIAIQFEIEPIKLPVPERAPDGNTRQARGRELIQPIEIWFRNEPVFLQKHVAGRQREDVGNQESGIEAG